CTYEVFSFLNILHRGIRVLGIFGYHLDELQGKPLETLLPERHRGKHHSYRNAYIEKPAVRAMGIERDLTGLHKNGTEVPVEIGLNPIETADGNYIVATITDITQRKKSELKLKQVNADLDEFTYVASHDLKSPLRGIESLLEWIEEDLGDTAADTVKNNLKRAHIRIKRMEKLIEDLLEYARSGRQQSETKTLDLKQTIDDIVQLLAPPDSFSIEIGGYLGEIQASSIPLETVLRNLISNALKHHDQNHGTIQITITPEDAYCIFDIKDDGPGIPTNAHERIFKLFQTLSSEDGSRSGVGLAVCKRLVEAHGGKIEVHAQDNQRGTRFRFWWPRFSRRELNV
ncbi:MAG: PAS domain-containing sensor histidine kinase, partial [Pseudomonadota bacterium]